MYPGSDMPAGVGKIVYRKRAPCYILSVEGLGMYMRTDAPGMGCLFPGKKADGRSVPVGLFLF